MGTLSKTLGSCGGYICGSHDLIEILKYQAPGFVYSVGLSPPATAAALASLRVLKSDPARVAKLQANGRFFVEEAKKAGLDTMTSAGYSVVPVMVGDPVRAVRLTDRLLGARHQRAADHSSCGADEGGSHTLLHHLEAYARADPHHRQDRCGGVGEHRQEAIARGAGDACCRRAMKRTELAVALEHPLSRAAHRALTMGS